jgi:hypothetical protein
MIPFSIELDQDRHNKIRHLREAMHATFAALYASAHFGFGVALRQTRQP